MNAQRLSGLAYEALLREARATPKPGLVDANNSGAHRDMDLALFETSAAAIRPYFAELVLRGAREADRPVETRLAGIRPVGRSAEDAMFAATHGVNTHKGAIFTLGVLGYVCGRLDAAGRGLEPETVCAEAGRMCRDLARELCQGGGQTKGERAFACYGVTGVRGEAAAGFPSVLHTALPALCAFDANENDRLCYALMHLIATVTDTNVLMRLGAEGAAYAKAAARAFLEAHTPQDADYREALAALDRDFIARGVSPGGCADLVAAAWFLDSVRRT